MAATTAAMDRMEGITLEFMPTFAAALISLLVITDPFGMLPVFLTLSEGDGPKWRNRQALKCGVFVFIMLIVFFAAGVWILKVFGFSLDALDLAGGLIVGKVGWDLMTPKDQHSSSGRVIHAGTEKRDISFVPLTMPIIAGPGAIAIVVALASHIQRQDGGLTQWLAVGLAIFLVALLTFLCFRLAGLLLKVLGLGGLQALSRIMGFLLMCIAAQMMIRGVVGVVQHHFLNT